MQSLRDEANAVKPEPVALNAQYIGAFHAEEDDDGDAKEDAPEASHADPPRTTTFRRKNRKLPSKKRNKGKKRVGKKKQAPGKNSRAPGKNARPSNSNPEASAGSGSAYSPKIFSERYAAFLKAACQDGMRQKEAQAKWVASAERAALLSDMPLPELKRRRFVSKSCTVNPFSKASLGGA